MVDATVSFAIKTLGDFLIEQVNIRTGVKDGVRWLKDELVFLQSSVRFAESRQDEELIRNWVKNVREVADEAVAILRNFSVLQQEHAASKQGVCHSLISYVCICKKEAEVYDIGKDIESLKERVVDIKKRRSEYGINEILATPNVQQKQRTFLRTIAIDKEVDVVGFEDDIKTLMDELDSEDLSRKVIAIHGMGGLGKTSLATKLYNASDLRRFDTRAKVCVSNEYNIKDVLKRLIKSFMGIDHEEILSKMDEHDLLHHLQELLRDRRYFVVIDDIWDTKGWEQIKIALPNQNNGSRVIVTTRNKRVAEMVDDKCFVHHLRFLTKEESWELFCKRAEPPQNLEKLGKEMVAKCGGLPLAIVVLSGLLLHKKNYEDWSNVKEHIWRSLKDREHVHIEEILSLSYKDLSAQMRDCFLYVARFPEDHIIDVHILKLIWIAEEFISEDDERDGVVVEDLAEDYLNGLINRNLIQIAELEWNGNVDKCRVHDLVRELAIDKAKEQKLLVIFDSSRQHPKPIHLLGGSRHVIYNGVDEYFELFEGRSDALKVRSLAVNNPSGRNTIELREMKMMYTRFKKLRVLDLTSVRSADSIPEEIGDLVLLKFLGLMDGYGKQILIPTSIGKLKGLQTLCGSKYSQSYTIPREIWELKELRHVTCGQYNGSVKNCRHQTKLQTLDRIGYKEWVQIDTLNINNLQTLSIQERAGGGGYAYTLESIANLTSLQTFTFYSSVIPTIKPLRSCKLLKSVDLFGSIKDPLEFNFLPESVTSLRLRRSEFTEDPMPILGNLTNLTTLELYEVYKGKKMVCTHNAFPSLQFLILKSMRNLEEWQVEDGALPSLISFKTFSCDRLKTIPVHLGRLRTELSLDSSASGTFADGALP